jgi:hypothetical protein
MSGTAAAEWEDDLDLAGRAAGGLRAGLQPRRIWTLALSGVSAPVLPCPGWFRLSTGLLDRLGQPIALAVFGPLWGWGWVDWGHHYIAVDPGRYALASGGHPAFSGSIWVHDPAHRGGVAFILIWPRARALTRHGFLP